MRLNWFEPKGDFGFEPKYHPVHKNLISSRKVSTPSTTTSFPDTTISCAQPRPSPHSFVQKVIQPTSKIRWSGKTLAPSLVPSLGLLAVRPLGGWATPSTYKKMLKTDDSVNRTPMTLRQTIRAGLPRNRMRWLPLFVLAGIVYLARRSTQAASTTRCLQCGTTEGLSAVRTPGVTLILVIPPGLWQPTYGEAVDRWVGLPGVDAVAVVSWDQVLPAFTPTVKIIQVSSDVETYGLAKSFNLGSTLVTSQSVLHLTPGCPPQALDDPFDLPPLLSRSDLYSMESFRATGGFDERFQSLAFLRRDMHSRAPPASVIDLGKTTLAQLVLDLTDCRSLGDRWNNKHLKDYIDLKADEELALMLPTEEGATASATCTAGSVGQLTYEVCNFATDTGLYGTPEEDIKLSRLLAAREALSERTGIDRYSDELPTFNDVVDQLTLHLPSGPKYIIIHPQHGLGNRLRAVASAALLARSSGRRLRIIWEVNAHLAASFTDLFDIPATDVEVTEYFSPESLKFLGSGADSYNHMTTDKGIYVKAAIGKHIYVKTAYRIFAPEIVLWSEYEAGFKRAYRSIVPNAAVQRIIRSMIPDYSFPLLGSDAQWAILPKFVGLHIRTLSSAKGQDIVGTKGEEYDPSALVLIELYRASCHYSHFAREIARLNQIDSKTVFFVATDTPEVLTEFTSTFDDFDKFSSVGNGWRHLCLFSAEQLGLWTTEPGSTGHIAYIERDCSDRGPICMQYAMADMYLLSHTPHLLTSAWSSFSESAQLMGNSTSSSPCAKINEPLQKQDGGVV